MENKNNKLQEMQIIEQNLNNILLQKQAFHMELMEAQSALKHLETSGEEVFKVIGQLMIKVEKEAIKKELTDKEKIINLRFKTLEKQEDSLSKKLEEIRKEIIGK